MLVAFLGCVKSGRPYVPLDNALPQRRVDKVMQEANPASILTPEKIREISEACVPPVPARLRRDDPFYILFTSGSTGDPKGVVISLGCLEHFVGWMLAEQQFVEQGETFLNQAPFSFDLSVMDLYCSLATGGTLFSISRDLVANPKLLYRSLAASGVTTWVSTPSFAHFCLADEGFNRTLLPRVQRFLFCGERLPAQVAATLRQRFPGAEVWNTYGPTEATVATTSVQIDDSVLQAHASLPVGRPMPGTEVLVTNEQGAVLGEREAGEIVVAGPNVAHGYLGREHSAPSPFFSYQGKRAYRTGDRGFFRDGLLFFEGRIDQQIKLNGHRIELGDVEANLRRLDVVRDGAVLPVRKKELISSLAAFVVLHARDDSSNFELARQIRGKLGAHLPAYMLPRRIVFLDALPLTANGKVDRVALANLL
jgi:D-alanine--poly(phosphoribitol) ligase subunit 1